MAFFQGIPARFDAFVYQLVELQKFFNLVAERTTAGVLIVDDKFRVLFANPIIAHDFATELVGKNYYKVIFGLNLNQPADKIKRQNIPLYKAFRGGKIKQELTYPTLTACNEMAYQVETYIAKFAVNGFKRKVALEFWNCVGDPEVFKDDPSFIPI